MAVNPAVFTPWFGPKEAAEYFRSLLQEDVLETEVFETNRYLLECVHNGAITPKIFAIWLFNAHSRFPGVLQSALRDEASRGVRRAGMNVLKCALRTDQWRGKGWDAVGGTNGLKEIFEKLSVQEAKELAKAIGACSDTSDTSKSQAVDELLHLLIPNFFKSSSTGTRPDGSRQLLRVDDLVALFNVSSNATVVEVFSTDWSDERIDHLMRHLLDSHMPLLRDIAVGSVPAYPPLRRRLLNRHLSAILTSYEPYESKTFRGGQASIPAINITLDLIDKTRGESEKAREVHWDTRVLCIDKTLSVARRLKVPFDEILAFLEQVLPALGHSGRKLHEWRPLIHTLIQFWAMAAFPEAYLESFSDAAAERRRERLHPSRPQKAHRDSLEIMLRTIFGTIPKTELGLCLALVLPKTMTQARLPLLKIVCKHLRGLEIDLDQSPPSKDEEQLLPWDSSFFMSLPGEDARWLFERAAQLSPAKSLTTSIPFEWPAVAGDSSSFVESMIRVHLESVGKEQANADHSVTRQLIDDIKLKAVKARDAGERQMWARLTVSIAVLSKNVRFLKDVLSWTSRFVRDPFVRPWLVRRIYEADVASVLSCVVSPTLADLAADVDIGNAALHNLMEQALLVFQEPWYKSSQDRGVGTLLEIVVSKRINAVKRLCRRGLGSEKEVVDTLFDKLVPMVLEYESLGITEGYESLGWGRLSGPLHGMECPQNPTTGVLKFIDSLAQQRDRLWAQQRLLRNPQTASFPEGLPRGLPLQYLFPSKRWTVEVMKSQEANGFIKKRVTEVVFCDASIALQKIDQENHRLGPFVDGLKFAISVYIGNGPDEEQGARILEIWRHYWEKIPSSAGHIESLQEYLCSFLRPRGLHKVARIIDPIPLPSLDIFQSVSRDSPSFEWEPRSENARRSSSNHWEETLLQHQFFATKQQGSLEAVILAFSHPNAWKSTAKSKAFDIWLPKYGPRRLSCQHKEALIASALLFLNSLTHNSARFLSKAFPEDGDVCRFPSAHLDYEFLSSIGDQGEAATAAISVLNGLVRLVPPSLLYELSLSLMETLDELESKSPKYALVQRCAFTTLILVRRSDKPELAARLGMKALGLFPKASSWHRTAFPSSLGKILSRETAERIMQDFTAHVFEALRKQREPASPKSRLENSEKTGIKITTVKMLSMMLAENKFGLSPSFVTCSLKDLFYASNHIDVRVTVCTALLDVLREYDDADDADEAYETFTSLASYAAGPSENSASGPWLQSEQAELPRVDSQRPLLDIFTGTAFHRLPSKYREQYTYKTLIPLVEESTRQHSTWMRRFLSRLELTTEELSVTDFGPFAPDLLRTVVSLYSSYLPREYLLKHRSWALSYLDCMKLRHINDKLTKQDRSWRTTNAGHHWNEWFDSHAKTKPVAVLRLELGRKRDLTVPNGITREAIAEEIVQRAAIIVRNPFQFLNGHIEVSLGRLKSLLSDLDITKATMRAETLPIVERIIADIYALRTEEWDNDPHRSPPVLPAKLQLQTLLLPYPRVYPDLPSRHETFASSVMALVEECATSPTYIADKAFLIEAMERLEREDARQCALEIGRGYESSPDALLQYLRVWLAQVVLLKWKLHKDKRETEVHEMVSWWKRSPNESVRSIGWSLLPQAM
ncbi:hypothetical protein BJX96DRAFT_150339 [Aspergillus floccosus]